MKSMEELNKEFDMAMEAEDLEGLKASLEGILTHNEHRSKEIGGEMGESLATVNKKMCERIHDIG